MRLRRDLSLCVLLLVLHMSTHHAWLLQSPRGVSIESINMRHMLKWLPLESPCGTTVYYSVQFQGEFELRVLNGSWVEAHDCQQMSVTRCDLTQDLGSDASYNLRVRAQCGGRFSPWAKLGNPFNRRDTILEEPQITVTTMGDALQVSVQHLQPTVTVTLTIWKRGEEHKASTQVIPAGQTSLPIAALQEGEVYCVMAQTRLDTQHTSPFTEPQCVSIRGPGTPWMTPTTVLVSVVLMAGLIFAVFWSIIHCKLDACQAYFRKEPLPCALRIDGPITRLKFPVEEAELCEPIQAVLWIGRPVSLVELSEDMNE